MGAQAISKDTYFKIIKRISIRNYTIGYVVVDSNNRSINLSKEDVLELAKSGKIINATYNKRTNSLIGKNGANLRGLVVLRIGNTRQQIKFKSDNNDKKVNGNKTYSKTLIKYAKYPQLIKIIKNNYKLYGTIESLSDKVRDVWGRNTDNTKDYQYLDIYNIPISELINDVSYKCDGTVYLNKNNHWLNDLDTAVRESLMSMIAYADLMLNYGNNCIF